jgi:xylulose-5-phosphate/fructose-6-phosphate phosphoketolase
VPGLGERCAHLRQDMVDERLRARAYTREVGDDMPEVHNWVWPGSNGGVAVSSPGASDTSADQ